jgi:cyclopropane fatty-acyl-phospholipid synthase-like methyltransferase
LAVWRKGSGCSVDRWSGCATGRGVIPAQARENIAAHYDLGNTFYSHFLDKELLYSSALFTADEQDLTAAQQAKMARLCEQLALCESDHLLEIGTGWGRWRNTRHVTTAVG